MYFACGLCMCALSYVLCRMYFVVCTLPSALRQVCTLSYVLCRMYFACVLCMCTLSYVLCRSLDAVCDTSLKWIFFLVVILIFCMQEPGCCLWCCSKWDVFFDNDTKLLHGRVWMLPLTLLPSRSQPVIFRRLDAVFYAAPISFLTRYFQESGCCLWRCSHLVFNL